MQRGQDDAAIALATNARLTAQHLGDYVRFAHGGSVQGYTVAAANVVHGLCRAQIHDHRAGLPLQKVVRRQHQGVLLEERFARVRDDAQPIGIGIGGEAHVGADLDDLARQIAEIRWSRLRTASKEPRRLTIQLGDAHPEATQQLRGDDAARAVAAIDDRV